MAQTPAVLQGLQSLRSVYDNPVARRQWMYLGELCSPAGTSLLTDRAIFKRSGGAVPRWFRCLEDFLVTTSHDRMLPGEWEVVSADTCLQGSGLEGHTPGGLTSV